MCIRDRGAEQAWKKAIELEPGNSTAHSNMAFVYMARNDRAAAAAYAREALKLDRNNQSALGILQGLGEMK